MTHKMVRTILATVSIVALWLGLASAQTLHVLHSFSGADGAYPDGGLVRDSAGNLYGTTPNGGIYKCHTFTHCGNVFRLGVNGKETVLYNFTGGADGRFPHAALLRDSAGNLYGTTSGGGSSGYGVVFRLNAGKLTVLHSFTGGADGANPTGALLRDAAGNLYGVTAGGGTGMGYGVVFRLSASGNLKVLYSFTGGADGDEPSGGLLRDGAGNLYGATLYGGSAPQGAGNGVVFEVDTTGKEIVLHAFSGGADGKSPNGDLIHDAAGNLYGTAYEGGSSGNGVVFKLSPTGDLTVLHTFRGPDGALPAAGLIRDAAGNFYGTTTVGGSASNGIIFKLDTDDEETVLHSFKGSDGALPFSKLAQDTAGNLYGTTQLGGACGVGIVFQLVP